MGVGVGVCMCVYVLSRDILDNDMIFPSLSSIECQDR